MDRRLRRALARALNDPWLGRTLDQYQRGYALQRLTAIGPDFTANRERLAGIRDRSVRDSAALADEFCRAATNAGATVIRAADAAQAQTAVLEFARRHGVSTIVKSKSLVSEEINLNSFLESSGLTVTETDLGEWILQLAGQRPSHFAMPAIHLSRLQVRDIFARALGDLPGEDVQSLVNVARRELRDRMLAADMGITGANVGIARSGTVVLVTNEGNGRFVTSFPRVQASIIGLDKIVPTAGDAARTLELLIPSATGQRLTSYVTFLTGKRPGLDELLIVLLDNGRSQLAADPELRDSLRCIRCCACLGVCPVYRQVGGHVFGGTYFAGVGVFLELMRHGPGQDIAFQQLCLTCGRCSEVCPVGIKVPDLIERLRRRLAERPPTAADRVAAAAVASDGGGVRKIMAVARPAARLVTGRDGMIRLPFGTRVRGRTVLPAPAARPLGMIAAGPREGPHAAMFAGCLTELFLPRVGEAVVGALAGHGCHVLTDRRLGCCGAPLSGKAAHERLLAVARKNVSVMRELEPDAIVAPCPSCARMLAHDYPRLLETDGEYRGDAEEIARLTRDFVVYAHGREVGVGQRIPDLKVTYHDSCHLRYRAEAMVVPRETLGRLCGLTLVEQAPDAACCGFAGSYALRQPGLSMAILKTKVTHLAATGADAVVTDCPGCMLQINMGLKEAGERMRVLHTAQLMAASVNQDAGAGEVLL